MGQGLFNMGEAPSHITPADYDMSKWIAEALHKHYPGHLWAVTAEARTGIATIRNLRLSGREGFVLHLKDLQHDVRMKEVMKAGGEILERYHLARGRFKEDEYDQLHTDFAGRFNADK